MKFKLSTYLFAAGAMAGIFIAIITPASAHEHAHKAGDKPMACCMDGTKAKASTKKTSTPMACCQKAGVKTAKVTTKASAKMTSAKGAMKCCAQAGKKL